MEQNKVSGMIKTLMEGFQTASSTKTVVGEVTEIGDMVIMPLIDVSFSIGAGGGSTNKDGKEGGIGGGMNGKLSPSSVLIISNGQARLVNVKATDNVSRALDLIPEIIEKIKPTGQKEVDEEVIKAAFEEEKTK